jgi:hypothetical protein
MSIRISHAVSSAAVAALAGLAVAQPLTPPVYTKTLTDAVTGDNNFNAGGFRYYTIDGGADSYQNDRYERPTAGGFEVIVLPDGSERYAAEEYLSFVDITQARFGFDNRYLYASIKVAGLTKNTKDGVNDFIGLNAKYAVRFGPDPDGRNSVLLQVDAPQFAGTPNTVFSRARAEGFRDTDADVGGRGGPIHGNGGPSGLNVTRTQNILEEQGLNGYDQQFITSDGQLESGGQIVLWQRVSPTDNTEVEIAFDYITAGFTAVDLNAIRYLQFDANVGGPSAAEGLWNDKYFAIDVGSPNRGIGSDNEFGTQGLGSLVGLDTVREEVAPPCPADFNGDGFVDFFDYDAYVLAFEVGGQTADFNGDGFIDFFDYDAYVLAFERGC